MQALQQTAQLGGRPGLQMPSTQSMLTRVPEQPASARAPLAGSLFPTPATALNTHTTPSLGIAGAAAVQHAGDVSTIGEGCAGSVMPRRPTPATGAVHVPYSEMDFEDDMGEEQWSEPDGDEAADRDAAPNCQGLFATPVPEAAAAACDTPGLLSSQAHVKPPGTAGVVAKAAMLALQVPVQEGDDVVSEPDSPNAQLLSEDAIVSVASPGHSSISFGSPARSAWGGFATPGRFDSPFLMLHWLRFRCVRLSATCMRLRLFLNTSAHCRVVHHGRGDEDGMFYQAPGITRWLAAAALCLRRRQCV